MFVTTTARAVVSRPMPLVPLPPTPFHQGFHQGWCFCRGQRQDVHKPGRRPSPSVTHEGVCDRQFPVRGPSAVAPGSGSSGDHASGGALSAQHASLVHASPGSALT